MCECIISGGGSQRCVGMKIDLFVMARVRDKQLALVRRHAALAGEWTRPHESLAGVLFVIRGLLEDACTGVASSFCHPSKRTAASLSRLLAKR